jgi:hypothetical protein
MYVKRTIDDDICVYKCIEDITEHTKKITSQYKILYRTLSTSEIFYKIRYYENFHNYENEICCLKYLQNSGFTTSYKNSWRLVKLEYSTDDNFENSVMPIIQHNIMIIKMDNYQGKSLLKLYIPWTYHYYYSNNGVCVNQNNFDLIKIRDQFPEQYIPDRIFEKIIYIVKILIEKYGIYHQNIHPGNFLEYEGNIIIVNFDQTIMKTINQ